MTTTYRDALRQALVDAMEDDDSVILLGEEVGLYGGAYGVTKGLLDRFGETRVIDTPISEPGIVGAAIGAAMTGLRPVAEIMYVDFAGLVMDQLANQAAKSRYMFGGQIGVPMVLRTQGGTGRSAAAQHSQSLEAWMMHVPGLRLAMPGTVSDAYHLLRDALRQPDPVCFIEHKGLYTLKGEIGPEPDAPWGQPAIRRKGTDLTIATYSRMLQEVLKAAEALAPSVEVEVIDLRTLNPLEDEVLMDSVRRTGRCLIVTEAVTTGSVASEIAARVTEQCFDWLEEPPLRLGGEDIPVPVAPALEAASIPDATLIGETARWLVTREAPSWAA
ncbi:alpha-ketoacid dehydrogenase subunit beta [Jannaschia aquimarina]|uniref:BfmBAB_3 protein n=1 Tax=Jannaschia aquimarina TaxID=935700 RepID=A0A0D1EDC2_9RHOB|nr:alpha-ketoacid dehydrogenase subunit beta [Jannaschia aquimarina]KIT14921.1 2-oxoisovalerate dehydrogenase subunit beta [Jannaschia aquimarina]SNS59390.1 pyruvate dehydrogenase E1 component beta subunit [Jannaschia aquimarina]